MRKFILAFLIMPCTLFGQYSKVEFLPPEAAALTRYVDYPVSHLTGIPDIQIPLHTVQVGSLTIPLTLSFHLDNYLRANQIVGSTGKGWSLSTELQISRTINGFDDLSPVHEKWGYYYNSTVPSNYKEGDVISRTDMEMNDLYKGKRDEEPDRFYYKLLNKSGAFYFKRQPDGTMKPTPVPYNGVKIEYNKTNGQFTIFDTDGTKYVFSTTTKDTESIANLNSTTLAWKCQKVTSANGQDEISFVHNVRGSNQVVSFNDRIEVYDKIQAAMPDPMFPANSPWALCCRNLFNVPIYGTFPFWQMIGVKGKEIAGYKATTLVHQNNSFVRLSDVESGDFDYQDYVTPSRTVRTVSYNLVTEIAFRGGKMQFTYTNNRILNSIKIINNNGATIKTILFNHINIVSGDQDYYRVLESLKINNEQYAFTYQNNIGGGWDMMTDYWGYQLRATTQSTRNANVTRHQIEVSRGNCVRGFLNCEYYDPLSPTTSSLTIGYDTPQSISAYNSHKPTVLKIKYPTGGTTEFIMGQHQYRSSHDSQMKGAGGYRIENIKYYDNTATLIKEKIYKYGPKEDGCGIVKNEPYFDGPLSATLGTGYIEQEVRFYWGSGYYNETYGNNGYVKYLSSSARKRTFLNGSNQRSSFESGSTVNYNEVAEYEMDNGVSSGKTVYKYKIQRTTSNTASPSNPYPFEQEEWDLAPLDSIIHYKYVSGKYDWVKRQKFTYNKYVDQTQVFRGKIWSRIIPELVRTVVPGINIEQWKYEQVQGQLTYHKRGLNTGCMQLLKKEDFTKDASGNITKEEINYFYDNPNNYTANRVERKLSDGSTLIEQTLYPEDYAAGGIITTLLNNNIVSAPIEKIKRRNGIVISGEVYDYNAYGNVTAMSVLETDTPVESGFKLSNKTAVGQFLPASGRAAFSKDSRYQTVVNVMGYDQYGNPTSVQTRTAPYDICYLWGYKGLYPIAEIQNVPYSTVSGKLGTTLINNVTNANTPSSADMQTINNLRSDPALKNAHISTYTYNPLVGMASATDPQGFTTYYDYDRVNRLKEIYFKENNVKKTLKSYDYNYKK